MNGVWGEEAVAGWAQGAQRTLARQLKSDEEYNTAIMLSKRLKQGYRAFAEIEAQNDSANIEAAKILYEMNTGAEFEGLDQEAVKYGIEEMGRVNHSFFQAGEGAGMVGYLSKIGEASDLQKLSFLHWVNSYEAMDADNWNELSRFATASIKDPTNYVGLSALAGYAIKLSGKKLGKTTAIEGIRKGLKLTAAGSFEGASFSGVADTVIQHAEIKASDNAYHQKRTEQDVTKTTVATGIGAGLGAVLPHTPSIVKTLKNKITGPFSKKSTPVKNQLPPSTDEAN